MNCFLSIIIPVYNLEGWLAPCVRSLMEQSETDGVEYIFVNDASTDSSLVELQETLQDYSSLSSQVRIVNHQINKGVSISRNDAIAIASGEWISFVDGDDIVDRNYVREIRLAIGLNQFAGLFVMGQCRYNDVGIYSDTHPSRVYKDTYDFYQSEDYNHSCAAYCFKAELISHGEIRFPEHVRRGEDQAFIISCLYYSPIVCSIAHTQYYYIFRPNSVTTISISIDTVEFYLMIAHHLSNVSSARFHNTSKLIDRSIKDFILEFINCYYKLSGEDQIKAQSKYRIYYKKICANSSSVSEETLLKIAYLSIPLLHFSIKIKTAFITFLRHVHSVYKN